jgi:hypothetical protein
MGCTATSFIAGQSRCATGWIFFGSLVYIFDVSVEGQERIGTFFAEFQVCLHCLLSFPRFSIKLHVNGSCAGRIQ